MEFLKAVAKTFAPCAQEHTFVFPNRRSIRFFNKYIGEEYAALAGKPLFAPRALTISDLFASLTTIKPVDPIEARYLLYKHYIELRYNGDTGQEPFDDFISWAKVIISDFNDIDKYLVNAKELFTNIKDLKEIEADYSFLSDAQREAIEKFWGALNSGGLSDSKEKFRSLWSIMYNLYQKFNETLELREEGYEGMIYRKVAENIEECEREKLKNLVFVGFNAPNKCERLLMDYSRNLGGDFYWDFYGPMVTDPDNKASMFIASLKKEYPSKRQLPPQVEEVTLPEKLNISLYPIASGVGGALAACQILEKEIGGQCDNTALLLPDQTLLMPLLYSIPRSIEKINVTMGYPVDATPLPDFMHSLASLQLNAIVPEGSLSHAFYHADVMALLQHRYIQDAVGKEIIIQIKEQIIKENKIYIEQAEPLIAGSGSALIKLLFSYKRSVNEIIEWQREILQEIERVAEDKDREFIYAYYKTLLRLEGLNLPLERKSYFRILREVTAGLSVPFKGEPLAGLQIMGPLEIRSLDFENLVILSANEGVFPSTLAAPTLIPYNLKVGFSLPTYEVQDAIAAYHFYRSISRVKNLYLIYNSQSDGLNRGEESRFVKQLRYHYECNIKEYTLSYPVKKRELEIRPIEKSAEIMQELNSLYKGGGGGKFSASAINCYIFCPIKFYYTYIKKLAEEEQVIEDIDAGKFGEIFHSLMQDLYKGYRGQIVTKEIIQKIKADKNLDSLALASFAKLKFGKVAGENLLIKEVIKCYAKITLECDSIIAPFYLDSTEYNTQISLPLSDSSSVTLKAIIDRIDKRDNILSVIDYKTGCIEPLKNRKADIEPDLLFHLQNKHYKELFQLYFYAYILKLEGKKAVQDANFNLIIYHIPKLIEDGLKHKITIDDQKLSQFGQMLEECIEQIFNPQIPFSPCSLSQSEPEKCLECKFYIYCRRRSNE